MANNMEYRIGFIADTSQMKKSLDDARVQLEKISNLQFNKANVVGFTTEVSKGADAARELRLMLDSATNVNTGKLDLSRFRQQLTQSGKDITYFSSQLQSLGPEGRIAFQQVASAVAQAEGSLFRVSSLAQKLWTTLANTARWQLSSSALMAFTGALRNAFQYSQDLNESLNNIRIVTGQSVEQMKDFAKEANSAARRLSTTTTDYTDASLIYYQQGLSDQEVLERTEVTIKMANTSRQSAEEVSEQLTSIWNNFYDRTQSLEYYADVITKLGAATASSQEEIAAGLEKFSAVANTVGLSYEYASAALATVTAQTRQSADTVGTAFRTLFTRLEGLQLGETLDDGVTLNKYSEALATAGVNILNANGELKQMDNILDELGDRWNDLDQSQKVALATTVGGARQYATLIALMDNWDDFQNNVSLAEGSTGTLNEQADIYAESWEAAKDRVTAAAEDIYDSLINDETFIKWLDFGADFLDFLNQAVEGFGGLKGLLLFITSILTNTFAPQLQKSVQSLVLGVSSLFKNTQKQNAALQQDFLAASSANKNATASEQALSMQVKFEAQSAALSKQTNDFEKKSLGILRNKNIELSTYISKQEESANLNRENVSKAISSAGLTAGGYFPDPQIFTQINSQITNMAQGLTGVDQTADTFSKTLMNFDKLKTGLSSLQSIKTQVVSLRKEMQASGSITDEQRAKLKTLISMLQDNKNLGINLKIHGNSNIETVFHKILSAETSLQQNTNKLEQNIRNLIIGANLPSGMASVLLDYLDAIDKEAPEAAQKMVQVGLALEEMGKNDPSAALLKARKELMATAQTGVGFAQSFVGVANILSTVGYAMSSLTSIGEAWKQQAEGEITTAQALQQTFMMLPMALQILSVAQDKETFAQLAAIGARILGIKYTAKDGAVKATDTAATWALKLAQDALTGSIGATLALVGIFLVAIAAVIGIIALIVKSYKDYQKELHKEKLAAEAAAKATQELKEAQEELASVVDDLTSKFDAYEDLIKTLNSLTKGTEDWNSALTDAATQTQEILKLYPELYSISGMIDYSSGKALINLDKFEQYIAEQEQKATQLYNTTQLSQMNTNIAQAEADIAEDAILGRLKNQYETNKVTYNLPSAYELLYGGDSLAGTTNTYDPLSPKFADVNKKEIKEEVAALIADNYNIISNMAGAGELKTWLGNQNLSFKNDIPYLSGILNDLDLDQILESAKVIKNNIQSINDFGQQVITDSFADKNYSDVIKKAASAQTAQIIDDLESGILNEIEAADTEAKQRDLANEFLKAAGYDSDITFKGMSNGEFKFSGEGIDDFTKSAEEIAKQLARSSRLVAVLGDRADAAASALSRLSSENPDMADFVEQLILNDGDTNNILYSAIASIKYAENDDAVIEVTRQYFKSMGLTEAANIQKFFKEEGYQGSWQGYLYWKANQAETERLAARDNYAPLGFTDIGEASLEQYDDFMQWIVKARANNSLTDADTQLLQTLYSNLVTNHFDDDFIQQASEIANWSTLSAETFRESLEEAGIVLTKISDEQLETFINMMQTATDVNLSAVYESLGKVLKEIEDLDIGDTIDSDIYNELSADAQTYFTKTADGQYMLIDLADKFYETVATTNKQLTYQGILDARDTQDRYASALNKEQLTAQNALQILTDLQIDGAENLSRNAAIYGFDAIQGQIYSLYQSAVNTGAITDDILQAQIDKAKEDEATGSKILVNLYENLDDFLNDEFIAEEDKNAWLRPVAKKHAEQLEVDWDKVQSYAQSLIEKGWDSYLAYEKAIQNYAYKYAKENASDQADEWKNTLSQDYNPEDLNQRETYDDIRSTIASALGVTQDFVSDDFIKSHTSEIINWANGLSGAEDALIDALIKFNMIQQGLQPEDANRFLGFKNYEVNERLTEEEVSTIPEIMLNNILAALGYESFQHDDGTYTYRKINKEISYGDSAKLKEQEPIDLEDEKDRYYEINRLLDVQSRKYDNLSKAKDRAFGKNRLDAIDKEIEALQDEYELLNRLISGQDAWLDYDKEQLSTEFGAEFNGDNILTNYNELIEEAVAKVNNSTSDAREEAEENLALLKELLANYEESYNKYYESIQRQEDIIREQADKRLEKIEYELEVKVKIQDMRKAAREFAQAIAQATGDELSKLSKSRDALLENIEATLGFDWANEYNSTYQKYIDELSKPGADVEAIMNSIQELQGDVISKGEELLDYLDQLHTALPDALDAAKEAFDRFTSTLTTNNALLDTIKELYELQGLTANSDVGYQMLNNVAQESFESSLAYASTQHQWFNEIDSRLQEAQAELAKMSVDSAGYSIMQEAVNALLEEQQAANEAMLTSAKDAMEAAQDIYTAAIERAQIAFEQALSGGQDLDYLQEKYDNYITLEERYLDAVTESYEINKLNRSIQNDIDKSNSSGTAARLKALQAEVAERQKLGKLSQYDIDLLNAKYELTLKQIALDEAQNAKTQMRLQRDSQGNWNYVYTADQDAINAAQQELEDSQQNYYELTKNQVKDVTSEIIRAWSEMSDKIKEIYGDNTLTVEQREQRIAEIRLYYSDLVLGLLDDQKEAYNDLAISGAESIDNFKNDFGDDMLEMTDAAANFEVSFEEYLIEAGNAAEEYENRIAEVTEQCGVSINDLILKIAQISEETNNVNATASTVIGNLVSQIPSIQSLATTYAQWAEQIERVLADLQKLAFSTTNTFTNNSGFSEVEIDAPDQSEIEEVDDEVFSYYQDDTPQVTNTTSSGNNKTLPEINNYIIASGDDTNYLLSEPWRRKPNLMVQFDTGGYTGEFTGGRLAMLHEKELVLNEEDTKRILGAVNIMRQLDSGILSALIASLDGNAAASMGLMNEKLGSSNPANVGPQEVQQHVDIQANFPGVQSASEIEAALNNLVNEAAQYASINRD